MTGEPGTAAMVPAADPGYPDRMRRSHSGREKRARPLPRWGCGAAILLLMLAGYGLYHWLVSIGFSGELHL
jgi:type VI protein secretion system component VasF